MCPRLKGERAKDRNDGDRPLRFSRKGDRFRVWSVGPDGKDATEDDLTATWSPTRPAAAPAN